MLYVDGYVLPVAKKKLKAYLVMARDGERLWRKFGALDYKECVGDDLAAKCGTPFPKALGLKRSETVVFAFVVFRSKAHRDRVNKKVMAAYMGDGKDLAQVPAEMPFDMARMVYGGFRAVVGSGSRPATGGGRRAERTSEKRTSKRTKRPAKKASKTPAK